MPHLAKRHIAQFVRRNCFRRLRFDLYSGHPEEEMLVGSGGVLNPNPPPDRETVRQSLFLLQKAGKESEEGRYAELVDVFPTLTSRPMPNVAPARVRPGDNAPYFLLEDVWPKLTRMPSFLIEAEYPVPESFKTAIGLEGVVRKILQSRGNPQSLTLGNARPDIIQALAPSLRGAENDPEAAVAEILVNGEVVPIQSGDLRIGLRVIDCKLSASASEAHFAEVAYYCMSLAAWLEATTDGRGSPLSKMFFVRADAAVWPGQHGNSPIVKLRQARRALELPVTEEEYLVEFESDLDFLPAEVFTARLRRFFTRDVAQALKPVDWQDVDFHVDNRCVGCEYLGHHWGRQHEDDPAPVDGIAEPDGDRLRFCKPRAKHDLHLSRLPGITDGARRMLATYGIRRVSELAALLPSDRIYDSHSALKAIRSVVPPRANILGRRTANLIHEAGTSAMLPKWVDVKIHLIVEFDPASGITGMFGAQVDFFGSKGKENKTFPVGDKSLDLEWAALNAMLTHVHACLLAAGQRTWTFPGGGPKKPTVQTYVWDRLTYEHLRRVIGRHLHRLVDMPAFRNMAWLFPPDQVLANPDALSMKSPVSIVSDAFRSLMAVDAPHHYSLLDCARLYPAAWLAGENYGNLRAFNVNVLHTDPLTDYVPVERIHEMWQDEEDIANRNAARLVRNAGDVSKYRPLPSPADVQRRLVGTMTTKLWALRCVVDRLTLDLQPRLEASAPPLERLVTGRNAESGISADGLIWLEHFKLQASAQRFENDMLRAMAAPQREARFLSARVTHLLVEDERASAFRNLEIEDTGWEKLWTFGLSDGSRDVKMKPGDTFSVLTEEVWPLQYLTLKSLADLGKQWSGMISPQFRGLLVAAIPHLKPWENQYTLLNATSVTIRAIDRVGRRLIVDADKGMRLGGSSFLWKAFDCGFMGMPTQTDAPESEWGILDPVVSNTAGSKIKGSLKGIGNPPLAKTNPRVGQALLPQILGLRKGKGAQETQPTPVDRFLWDAGTLAKEPSRFDSLAGAGNPAAGLDRLTPSQRRALDNGIGRRLSLIWGPPGTGKSLTCRALLAALAEWSSVNGQGVRVLVTGSTWTAIDNVCEGMPRRLADMKMQNRARIFRLKSASSEAPVPAALEPFVTITDPDDPRFADLVHELERAETFVLVASTCHQVAGLVKQVSANKEKFRANLFDFVIVDEASQMDVAYTTMVFSSLAEGSCVTVVGDDKQMAPIHQVPPPDGLETMVGSIYDYYRNYTPAPIEPVMLDVNYRSNAEIVEFAQAAGYPHPIYAHFPGQRLSLAPAAPGKPADWPSTLDWSPEWDALLQPGSPLVAVIHEDDMASQSNQAEAHAVACLVRMLWGRLRGMDDGRASDVGGDGCMDLERFLTHGVGVVTPHRAQQGTVVGLLESVLPKGPALKHLFEAVDTVERFQGQERMVMIASLGLGDLDQIRGEEEFLYSLNRFNVIASRAQAKFILLASRTLLDHIPSDSKIMRESGLIKQFAGGFLKASRATMLPRMGDVEVRTRRPCA